MREVAKASTIHGVRAFAPATVANLGPGLDILGLAVTGSGDTVSVERAADSRVTIRSSGHPEIPDDPARNTAGIAANQVRRKAGASGTGLVLEVSKGLPLSGGQGGSAASAVVAALCRRDWDLLRRAVEDRIAEPVRAPLPPGFSEAQRAALRAGALGCSISGSGPAAFAFAVGEDRARQIAEAMISGYRSRGVTAQARVARIDGQGARVLPGA